VLADWRQIRVWGGQ